MTSGHFEFVIQFLDQIRALLRPRSNCNIDNNLFMAISETPIHPELHVNGEAKLILPAGYDCESDEQSWWLAFSRSFHTLMDKASYSKEQQMKYASFVFQNIIPFLGPAPELERQICNMPMILLRQTWLTSGLPYLKISLWSAFRRLLNCGSLVSLLH